ncbi:glycoside hydrolase family 3 C-terminal domain-containing protein [Plantactinospora sp. S1510]|uniref:Glycoside hydrolase family 3 C-terminal domain-containing protein n=1 Tax=Plantactinospora alkalitolerans TaxID=2789879 RepID=A0ABS0H5V0_9ACTN|nr:glycoside hydrolase family 3 C-terminal domain-containing protein [Plantactinospora alkalitolerans]MBF9133840.1 glycoside hydrolase family 3 C-terminal domain-containing protein [Plantactinospora alkalitolerans]
MRARAWAATVVAVVLVTGGGCGAEPAEPPTGTSGDEGAIYLDRSYSPRERAVDLVSRMTLTEKAAQMVSSQSAALPRLGIPAYGWWNEAAHGVAREGILPDANPPTLTNTTSYPVDLSLGATWNPELVHREATQISDEAREVVRDNRLDLNFYSPTVNLARDPRWGRGDEAFSEDPLLTAALAAQFVNGMEGKNQAGRLLPESGGYLKTSTTLKHYAANNSEFDRLTGSANMDDRTLREYYTAQFREVVRRSSPAAIMTSYNRVNGVPASASGYLMDELARQTFGFAGFFTSDCDSIREIEHGHHWQPPGQPEPLDHVERHAWANAAGEDLNCQQGLHDQWSYANTIPDAVARGITTPNGRYTEEHVDAALVRLLTTRIRLGEFDPAENVPWVTAARSRVAPGSWTNSAANRAGTQTRDRLALAREVGAESIVLLKNEVTRNRHGDRSGRGGRNASPPLLPLRVPATGAYRVVVIGHYANPPSMYLGGYSSIQAGAGQANEVNGYAGVRAAIQAINPGAAVDHLPGVTPGTLAEVDPASVAAASSYDAVIVYAGTDDRHSREEVDRDSLALPGAQASLISQVAARNPNTVVYLETAGQVDVADFEAAVPALLWSSYNGQRKGEALADVLLGARNPSGRLPFTWYRDAGQLPPIDDYGIRGDASRPGRTYMYFDGDVSYPFGHGLGYTGFAYSRPVVDRQQVDANGSVRVSVDVTNTGSVAGSEVVQLYAGTPTAPAARQRPDKRLAGFQKISLRPKQTRRVAFTVELPDLAFFDDQLGRYVVDQGPYLLQVGRSSADADPRRQARVLVGGSLRPELSVVTATAPTLYPPNTVVSPRLTVAMSDDTRYGYRAEGASIPLPAGSTVKYHSNRPGVVSVDPAGIIRTGSRGVATVTATVSYQGVSQSTEFSLGVR